MGTLLIEAPGDGDRLRAISPAGRTNLFLISLQATVKAWISF
jgi:hypothetical protein